MQDLTEQQEQEMIRRAKAGDPEANYQMSLWALDQAIAEPDEERWNRLAAKCLVKAAEAGYEPAREKMNELLEQSSGAPAAEPAAPASEFSFESAPKTEAAPLDDEPDDEPDGEPAASPRISAAGIGAAFAGFAAAAAAKVKGLFAKSDKSARDNNETGRAGKGGFLNFSEWDDAKWKKMQRICVIICIVLVLLIVILLLTGRKRHKEPADVVPTPVAELVDTPAPSATPEPVPYPDDAIRQEIAAASLDTYPEDADFVTEPTSRTVSTSSSPLNMRRSPDKNGSWVSSLPSGTAVDVYAFKNGWALVKSGNTWGWCSVEYLK